MDEMKALRMDIKEVKEDIIEMKRDISEMKMDIDDLKMDIGQMKTDINQVRGTMFRNDSMFYELLVKQHFEKDPAFEVYHSFILDRQEHQGSFDSVARDDELKEWNKALSLLKENGTLDDQSVVNLSLKPRCIEFNFVLARKNSTEVDIIEATSSELRHDGILWFKLIQLERQIRFYEKCFPTQYISRIGIIFPKGNNPHFDKSLKRLISSSTILERIRHYQKQKKFVLLPFGTKPFYQQKLYSKEE